MPVVACPKCPTALKIPDGAAGHVKCPKCNAIFAVAAPPVAATPAAVKPAPAPKPAAKPETLEPDFEVVDEPKPKKKAVVVEIDDDDRPRSKRRRDDDDDDDDDRPRKKKRRRDDEDDDWQPAASGGSFGPAKVGMLMVSISLWLYLGTFALLAFYLLIAWLGASIPNGLMILTGLLGLANWVVALIGLGFCIAGPSKSRGLAIAATAVAAVHLIMAFVVANNEKAGAYTSNTARQVSSMNKATRLFDLGERIQKETDTKRRESLVKEMRDLAESERGSGRSMSFDEDRPSRSSADDMRWNDLATLQLYSDQFIGVLAYRSKGFSDYLLGLLSGLLEVARLVLIVLLVGSVARAAKDHDAANKSTMATFFAGGAAIAAMLVVLIVAVILDSMKPDTPKDFKDAVKSAKNAMTWPILGELLIYGLHIGSLVLPAVLALQAKNAAARRAR